MKGYNRDSVVIIGKKSQVLWELNFIIIIITYENLLAQIVVICYVTGSVYRGVLKRGSRSCFSKYYSGCVHTHEADRFKVL